MIRVPAQITIPDHYFLKPADVIVERVGDMARAVDKYGNIIAQSSDHAYVIQEAIDKLPKYGVLVLTGEFYIARGIKLRSYIRIIGYGARLYTDKKEIMMHANYGAKSNDTPMEDIVIEGLEFDGGAIINNDGSVSRDGAATVIGFYNCRNIVLCNIVVRNIGGVSPTPYGIAIVLEMVRNARIEGIVIDRTRGNGLWIREIDYESYNGTQYSSNISVVGCHVYDTGDDGIAITHGKHITITGCVVRRTLPLSGFSLRIEGDSEHVSINDNVLIDSPANIISLNGAGGYKPRIITIIGNIIGYTSIPSNPSYAVGWGITVNADKVVISNNILRNVANGIRLEGCNDVVVYGNISLRETTGGALIAFWVTDVSNIIVARNVANGFNNLIYNAPGYARNNVVLLDNYPMAGEGYDFGGEDMKFVMGMIGLPKVVTSLPASGRFIGEMYLYYDTTTSTYYLAVWNGSTWVKTTLS